MIVQGELTDTKQESTIRKALNNIPTLRRFEKVRANIDGFETPARLTQRDNDNSYIPDITAVKNGRKSYFEIAIKSARRKHIIRKWRLLSELARIKKGKFYLLVPRGNYAFVQRTLSQHPIEAEVVKI